MPREQKGYRITTFLIPNLHCPSCVTHIKEALDTLDPKPLSVSHSIVGHRVTVQHSVFLSVSKISNTLSEAGYDVFDTVDLSPAADPLLKSHVRQLDQSSWFDKARQKWSSLRKADATEERKRLLHTENCDACRVDVEEGRTPSHDRPEYLTPPSTPDPAEPLVKVDKPAADTDVFEVTVGITGMTCSSCVGAITEALREKLWVRSANINLLSHSGVVRVNGDGHEKEIVQTIEDVGYDASVESSVESGSRSPPAQTSDQWEASFALGGMTCSSCVNTISSALRSKPFVKKVDINLISHSGKIVFNGKNNVKEIQTVIEDAGYEATLNDLTQADVKLEKDARRNVILKIDGIHCEHCPEWIRDAVESFNGRVRVEKLPTGDEPFLRISYIPEAPDFTIRQILQAVSGAHEAFSASIYHPPSLEERSQQMRLHEKNMILYRAILSGIIAIPTFIIGIVYMTIVPPSNPTRHYLMKPWAKVNRAEWSLFILATPVYFFCADIFHRRTIKELRAMWRPGSPVPLLRRFYRFGSMNMLMSMGTSIAYFASIAALIIRMVVKSGKSDAISNLAYFDSVVFLALFLLIGRLIEAYSKAKTGDAISLLGNLRPREALLVKQSSGQNGNGNGNGNGHSSEPRQQTVNVDLLDAGDIVRVQHGASPPSDGTVVEGESKFDESSLTGESKLVSKAPGDQVFSGTINQGSAVSIRVTGSIGASMLDQIIQVVREGQTRRAPVERVADIITGYFVPVVTLIAILTWLVWLALGLSGALPADYMDSPVGGWPFWSLQFAIAVFVVACPCGIGLAAPTALFVGGGLAAQHGILVKGGGEAFQEASGLDVIVFDKTGTLTVGGEPEVTGYEYCGEKGAPVTPSDVFDIIKRMEDDSSHPIARAASAFAKSKGAKDIKANDVEEIAGHGMKGNFTLERQSNNTVEAVIGNEALMSRFNVTISDRIDKKMDSWKREGKSVALVGSRVVEKGKTEGKWSLSAVFATSDPIRPESRTVIKSLQQRGVEVWMISGDNPTTAYAVGEKVGIHRENILAGVLPDQKADKIKYLQGSLKKKQVRSIFGRTYEHTTKRATIAMVGDGINDSPALTVADVGIAIGSGSDIAISSAEFVLVSSSLTSVLTLIDLSRAVFRRIKVNFAWALVYNLVALPVAAGALYWIKSGGRHVRLDPVWASLAMALSSISVVCSSLLLRSRIPWIGFRAQKVQIEAVNGKRYGTF